MQYRTHRVSLSQDNVPKALSRLPLISLRLIVRSPSSSGTGVEAALDKPTRMQTTYRRKEAISSLPGKVFDAVPTLRVLAIAEEVDQIGRRPMAAGGASATPKARHLYMEGRSEDLPGWERHLEWGTLDRARFRLHWWYRASPRDEPMRVPEKEGERVYAAVLRACTTTTGEPASTADIERKFVLRSRVQYWADGCVVHRASCVHVSGIGDCIGILWLSTGACYMVSVLVHLASQTTPHI